MNNQKQLTKKVRDYLINNLHMTPKETKTAFETMTKQEMIYKYDLYFVRVCSECGRWMNAGFCIESGMDYYCSQKHLFENMSKKEYLRLYDDGNGDSYWTEW